MSEAVTRGNRVGRTLELDVHQLINVLYLRDIFPERDYWSVLPCRKTWFDSIGMLRIGHAPMQPSALDGIGSSCTPYHTSPLPARPVTPGGGGGGGDQSVTRPR